MSAPDTLGFAATQAATPPATGETALGETLPVNAHGSGDDVLHATSRVGRLALLRKLGEGGMGVVYAAYDEALDRRVAVKVLKRGVAASAWLVREAQALAKLSHPNVVPVYDVGEHEGSVYLAMEFVEGRTLRAFAEEQERSLGEVLRALAQAGRGLAAAHEAGLIHRDFKPENVLVGNDGRARVVDFGIAGTQSEAPPALPAAPAEPQDRADTGPSAFRTPLTQAGALIGTPAYMSPEQYRGERATPASDQWSFAVSLFEVAYGQLPFDGDGPVQLAANILTGRLRDVSTCSAPWWVGQIVKRGLSPDPAARYPSMSALVAELEAQLPQPHDDPWRVRREQAILFGTLFVYAVGVTVYTSLRGVERAVSTSADLLRIGSLFLLVAALAVGAVWKKLRTSSPGRRFAALFVGTPAVVLVHRVVAAGLGESVLHTMVMDLFLVSLAFAVVALIEDRRLFLSSFLAAAGVAIGVFRPELAPVLFGVAGMGGLGICIFIWGRQVSQGRPSPLRTTGSRASR
jgi:serine/threonine-protein kinase